MRALPGLVSIILLAASFVALTGCNQATEPEVTFTSLASTQVTPDSSEAPGNDDVNTDPSGTDLHWFGYAGGIDHRRCFPGDVLTGNNAQQAWKIDLEGLDSMMLDDENGYLFISHSDFIQPKPGSAQYQGMKTILDRYDISGQPSGRFEPTGRLVGNHSPTGDGGAYCITSVSPKPGDGFFDEMHFNRLVRLDSELAELWHWEAPCDIRLFCIDPGRFVYVVGPEDEKSFTVWKLSTDGQPLWKWCINDHLGEPAVSGSGRLFFGSRTGRIYCLSTEGNLEWTYTAWKPSLFNPSRKVKYGTAGLILLAPDGRVVCSSGNDREVVCLTEEGELLWKFKPKRDFSISMAIDNSGILYVGDHLGYVSAIDTQGLVLWSRQVSDFIAPELAVAGNDSLYCHTCNGLYALRSTDGEILWHYPADGFAHDFVVADPGRPVFGIMELAGESASIICLGNNSQSHQPASQD